LPPRGFDAVSFPKVDTLFILLLALFYSRYLENTSSSISAMAIMAGLP
jgi:hypothetical protein